MLLAPPLSGCGLFDVDPAPYSVMLCWILSLMARVTPFSSVAIMEFQARLSCRYRSIDMTAASLTLKRCAGSPVVRPVTTSSSMAAASAR
ncbi:hypothetical protein [Streptomyces albiaxialis]|uniref:hypothetical protein n=1 Tax=Streptomyces albiaxialis TaxID=329523 RepID=UPI0031E1A6A4